MVPGGSMPHSQGLCKNPHPEPNQPFLSGNKNQFTIDDKHCNIPHKRNYKNAVINTATFLHLSIHKYICTSSLVSLIIT